MMRMVGMQRRLEVKEEVNAEITPIELFCSEVEVKMASVGLELAT